MLFIIIISQYSYKDWKKSLFLVIYYYMSMGPGLALSVFEFIFPPSNIAFPNGIKHKRGMQGLKSMIRESYIWRQAVRSALLNFIPRTNLFWLLALPCRVSGISPGISTLGEWSSGLHILSIYFNPDEPFDPLKAF
jgi:hypothetical protein